jgi:outer membrane receptor for ferrienterochelin and colicin
VYKPRRDTTIHAGFARNFQVPNFQGISPGIAALKHPSGGVSSGIPLNTNLEAETDYAWNVGYTHEFTSRLMLSRTAFRIDHHYIDKVNLISFQWMRPLTASGVMEPGSRTLSPTIFPISLCERRNSWPGKKLRVGRHRTV